MSSDSPAIRGSTSLDWNLIEEQRRLFDQAQQEKQEIDEVLAALYEAYFEDLGPAERPPASGRVPEEFRQDHEQLARRLNELLRESRKPPSFMEHLRDMLKRK